jgi:hypothetical protein
LRRSRFTVRRREGGLVEAKEAVEAYIHGK